jgi:8-oxo-dGTP diphosphatase
LPARLCELRVGFLPGFEFGDPLPLLERDLIDEFGEQLVQPIVTKRLKKQRTVVICSHGPVIPEIVREIARATGSDDSPPLIRARGLGTGDFAVLHLSHHKRPRLVAVETHSPS